MATPFGVPEDRYDVLAHLRQFRATGATTASHRRYQWGAEQRVESLCRNPTLSIGLPQGGRGRPDRRTFSDLLEHGDASRADPLRVPRVKRKLQKEKRRLGIRARPGGIRRHTRRAVTVREPQPLPGLENITSEALRRQEPLKLGDDRAQRGVDVAFGGPKKLAQLLSYRGEPRAPLSSRATAAGNDDRCRAGAVLLLEGLPCLPVSDSGKARRRGDRGKALDAIQKRHCSGPHRGGPQKQTHENVSHSYSRRRGTTRLKNFAKNAYISEVDSTRYISAHIARAATSKYHLECASGWQVKDKEYKTRPHFLCAVMLFALHAASSTAQTAPGVATPVPPVAVTSTLQQPTDDQKLQAEGAAAGGYRVDTTTVTGPLKPLALQDAPYSISVMPLELIENVQAASADELFRMNPLTQLVQPDGVNGRAEVNLRGFLVTDNLTDGIRSTNGWGQALENVERVEVFSGLSGFFYGANRVGGEVNYVTKRPTLEPFASVTVGDYGGGNVYGHGDFGGPLTSDGTVGYRLNALVQGGGDTPVSDSSLHRDLISGAVDWHAASNLLVQLDASHYSYLEDGVPPTWVLGTAKQYPQAPPADRLWSQPWTYLDVVTNQGAINLKWDIASNITFRSAFRYAQYGNSSAAVSNTIEAGDIYTQSFQARAQRTLRDYGGYGLFDFRLDTGPVHHQLTAGFYGNRMTWEQQPNEQKTVTVPGMFSLSGPVYVPEPSALVGSGQFFTSTKLSETNYVVGDEMALGDEWSALVGGDYAGIRDLEFSAPDKFSSPEYLKSKWTPTAALIFKPLYWVSTYASYVESLQEGENVPDTPIYTNAGAQLQPYTSRQYELGVKATVGAMLLTVAAFDIDKANQFANLNPGGSMTYVQDGREIHKGFEMTATGKITADWTVWGGLTLMNASVRDQANEPALEGKTPANVSDRMAKLYTEYAIEAVPGLAVTGGVYYMSDFYADALNTIKLPGYTLGDVGARFGTTVSRCPLVVRLNVTNVANRSYWQDSNWTGAPRAIVASAQMTF